jgi:hypothetical protein
MHCSAALDSLRSMDVRPEDRKVFMEKESLLDFPTEIRDGLFAFETTKLWISGGYALQLQVFDCGLFAAILIVRSNWYSQKILPARISLYFLSPRPPRKQFAGASTLSEIGVNARRTITKQLSKSHGNAVTSPWIDCGEKSQTPTRKRFAHIKSLLTGLRPISANLIIR